MSEVVSLKEVGKYAPKIKGISTGIKELDNMFYIFDYAEEKPKPKSLCGIPQYSVINVTGVSDTGKSIVGEQFAVTQAGREENTLFITVEAPAEFLYSALVSKAIAMSIDKAKVEECIYILDLSRNFNLRGNINNLIKTLETAIISQDIKHIVIDSVTGLYESKEMFARDIVRTLYNFLKIHKITTIMIAQKRSGHEYLSAEAAGGFAVSHIVDGTIVLSKQIITNKFESSTFKKPIGDVVRLIRIDGCRMCAHDNKTYVFEITPEGLIKILYPLSKITEGGEKI